jgi:hypothetical protein
MPEVLQTSYGSLTVGLDAKPGQILLTNPKLAARACGHRARRLDPHHAGERQSLRQAEPRVELGPVEAECCNFDQHLFGPGVRIGRSWI